METGIPPARAPLPDADRPLVLAVAGDSASGKSTLSRGIEYVLGPERIGRICTDDYHRFDRAERAARGMTPLSPEANDLDLLARHLGALLRGRAIVKPTYGHDTGTFGGDERVEPAEILIVEGLLPLVDRASRDAIDVAVFCAPDERLRRRWKLERDVFERGYSATEVVEEINRREPDAEAYVHPQRGFADIVVAFGRDHGDDHDPGDLSVRLTVRPILPYAELRATLGSLSAAEGGSGAIAPIRWSTAADPRGPVSVLDIDGDCPPAVGAEIESVLWAALRPDDRLQRERLGVVRTPGRGERRSEALALAQLLIVSSLVGVLDAALGL